MTTTVGRESTRPVGRSGDRPGTRPGGRGPRRWGQQGAVHGARGTFALFAEVLLTGVYVAVLSVPVVTALPALTAGVRHLRRFVAGESDSVGRVWEDVRAACSGVWGVAVGSLVAFALVGLDLWAVSTGVLPGGVLVGAVSAAVGAGLLLGLLRAAGEWEPGARWTTLVADGVRGVPSDLPGSALLLSGAVMAGVLVWMLKPLVLVVGGLLALAVVGTAARRAARTTPTSDDA